MNKKLFSKADEESIDIIERALGDLRTLGATVVDPGPEGALFDGCVTRYAPQLLNAAFGAQRRNLFPVNAAGEPATDYIAALLDMALDPAKVPAGLSIRTLGGFGAQGEGKYMTNKYLRERGDANIKTNADLISKATFYQDPNFPDRKQMRENIEQQVALDTAARLQGRLALVLMKVPMMPEQQLDALVSPTARVWRGRS